MKSPRSSLLGNRSATVRLLLVCAPAAAFASLLTHTPVANAIWSSYPVVDECHWPSTVRLVAVGSSQYCTGVYLGNGVIVTAGHCVYGANPHDATSEDPGAWVYFGETTCPASQAIATVDADCTLRPDFEVFKCGLFGDNLCGSGPDLAYCVLREQPEQLVSGFGADPLANGSLVVPMVPTGCERDWLHERLYSDGTELLTDAVGMGSVDKTPTSLEMGSKRHVQGQLVRQIAPGSDTKLGDLGMAALEMYQPSPWDITKSLANGELGQGPIRDGDSGGPLMVEMPDGTHRVIGIAAAIKGRNNYDVLGYWSHFVYYTPLPSYLRWIESDSGLDVTPCHEWNGGWQFDEDCDGYHGDATPEGRKWTGGCYDLDTRVPVTACGGAPKVGSGPHSVKLPGAFGTSAGTDLDWQIHNVLQEQQGKPAVEMLFADVQVDEMLGTRLPDTLIGTALDDLLRGAAGNDVLDAGLGNDVIFAGEGADVIQGRDGNDRIHPGTDEDFVDAGPGDDYVVVYDACELAAGESLVGGPGHDVLITPATPERMAKLGVFIDEFEEIVVTTALTDAAWCSNPNDAPTWSQ